MYNSVLMSLDMEGLNIIYGCGAGLLSSSLRFLEAGGLSLESSWLLATVVVVGLSTELERSFSMCRQRRTWNTEYLYVEI